MELTLFFCLSGATKTFGGRKEGEEAAHPLDVAIEAAAQGL